MNPAVVLGLLLGFTLTARAASAPNVSFDRYQVILDRQPFGVPLQTTATETSAAPALVVGPGGEALGLRACSLVMIEGEGPRAGLVEVKGGKSYMLSPGETIDGIRLVSVDMNEEQIVIQRGTEMAVLKLKEASPTERRTSVAGGSLSRPGLTRTLTIGNVPSSSAAPSPPVVPPPAPPRLQGEELQRHLQQYQMEVIRKGLPPLPIPLTPEMDRQLVQEGVLPPQEPVVIQQGGAQIIIAPQPAVPAANAPVTQ
ncbi:MAG: hypothetical protein N2652_03440 [Kiritimatiellae bacterium]|nr:hypothetical protein [Kiritimatiellia bacterium]